MNKKEEEFTMLNHIPIADIYAREILDSRGNPTIEVEVLAGEKVGRAQVPSGASTGVYEACELRDEDERFNGKGVRMAAEHVNREIAREIIGENVLDQMNIDRILNRLDRTDDKSGLGANAILGTSIAVAKTAARCLGLPLYQYMGGVHTTRMPVPMMNIINGGVHADNTLDIQEFMIVPHGFCCFHEALRAGTEVYHALSELMEERQVNRNVGDEGGFAPNLTGTREALGLLTRAIEKAGYRPGEEIGIALDAAASEMYCKKGQGYYFPAESTIEETTVTRSTEEMIDFYAQLVLDFPIVSIEDPLDQDDLEGWELITTRLGQDVQLVGDDLFVTNPKRLKMGIERGIANAVLIKPNQIGTLSETMDTIRMAKEAGYRTILSHRSGDTEDAFIADLAVAFSTGQIKTGAPCRAERTSKYNELLRIEGWLGSAAEFTNPFCGIRR
jgi:enolase